MTKEEAIVHIKDIICESNSTKPNIVVFEQEKEALYMAIEALEQPKTGHWINGDDICPCCGKSKFEDLDADIWADWRPKYCPNCGSYNGGTE